MFQSPYIEDELERIALNSKHQPNSSLLLNIPTSPTNLNSLSSNFNTHSSAASTSSSTATVIPSISSASNQVNTSPNSNNTFLTSNQQPSTSLENNSNSSKLCALLAISFKNLIRLWIINDETNTHLIGNFCLNAQVDSLFFIGSQLVATSSIGKIGVWNIHGVWQTQDITPISCFDTAGSFLLLGGQNGVLYYIDMQKFPLRMKDNDLLVTELYKDPLGFKHN